MIEEFYDIKDEMEELENRLRYITMGSNGDNVDPQMMWHNILLSQDEMFPLKELVRSCDEDLKKLKEMVLTLARSDNDFNELKEMVIKRQSMVFGEKEMKLMIGVLVCLASVVIIFLIYLFK